jgi:hypothetical protein
MSDMVVVEVRGLDEAQRRLDANLDRVLRRGTRRAIEHVRAVLATYPPKPPGSTYDRTGSLGRAWAVEVRGLAGNIVGIAGNTMPYAPKVQDLQEQRDVHRGRWPTVQGVVQKEAGSITNIYQDELDQELEN